MLSHTEIRWAFLALAIVILCSCAAQDRMTAQSLSEVQSPESPQQQSVVKKYRELASTQSLQWVDPQEITRIVSDYRQYATSTKQRMSAQMEQELAAMEQIAQAAALCQKVRDYYAGPYDAQKNSQLADQLSSLVLTALNNGQQGEVERYRHSLTAYPQIVAAARNIVSSQLPGDIITEAMAHEVKTDLTAQMRAINGNRPEGKMCFTRYYTGLNRAFDALVVAISVSKEQTDQARQKFLNEI